MSWIKKTESELEDEKKEKLAYLAKQKKQQQEEYIPTHPYNILHRTEQPSWLNKDTKDNIKNPDNVKTEWKEISYSESLQHIAKMLKSSNKTNTRDKPLLADIINM